MVRERIYAKAGMPNGDSYDIDLVVPNLAIGYSRERTASGTRPSPLTAPRRFP